MGSVHRLLGVRPSSEVNVMRTHQIVLLGSLTAALISCSSDPTPSGEDVGQVAEAAITDNGLHVNGLHVNGLHVNGLHVNGLHVNGTTLNGLHVNGPKLEGTVFSGTVDGNPVSGQAFSGAVMSATIDGHQGTLQVRIDDVTPTDDPDITLYGVSVLPPTPPPGSRSAPTRTVSRCRPSRSTATGTSRRARRPAVITSTRPTRSPLRASVTRSQNAWSLVTSPGKRRSSVSRPGSARPSSLLSSPGVHADAAGRLLR